MIEKQDMWDHLRIALWILQEKHNSPRGISCVQSICTYLGLGDIASAKAVSENERDKIGQYDEIVVVLHKVWGNMGTYYDQAIKRQRHIFYCECCGKAVCMTPCTWVWGKKSKQRYCSSKCQELGDALVLCRKASIYTEVQQ